MLDSDIEAQIADLARRYGSPLRVDAVLSGRPFDPIGRGDRRGEVCMVVRRPGGRLLTAIKTFYPPGAFRLLTGGVHHGERIEEALMREVAEETGLDVAVRRFLAVVEYRLETTDDRRPRTSGGAASAPPGGDRPRVLRFATFAFLVDELCGELGVRDPEERLEAFREIDPGELPALAAHLEGVADRFDEEIGGSWRDWGRFRAIVHRAVHQALADDR